MNYDDQRDREIAAMYGMLQEAVQYLREFKATHCPNTTNSKVDQFLERPDKALKDAFSPPTLGSDLEQKTPEKSAEDALKGFSQLMCERLRINPFRADRELWLSYSSYYLFARLTGAMSEVAEGMMREPMDVERLRGALADLANFCMMLADKAGGLGNAECD